MSGPHDDLAERIDALVDELDERAFTLLREASAARGGRPAEDKRLTQARRALEKAAHALRSIGDTADLTDPADPADVDPE